jgi:hypothetical protein
MASITPVISIISAAQAIAEVCFGYGRFNVGARFDHLRIRLPTSPEGAPAVRLLPCHQVLREKVRSYFDLGSKGAF